MNQKDKVFRVKMSQNNNYGKVKMSKSSSSFQTKTEVTPRKEDIYVDEVIYYDGGDVEGYGNGN